MRGRRPPTPSVRPRARDGPRPTRAGATPPAHGAGLAVAIQADSPRYVPCGNPDKVPTLLLCPADDINNWAVRYDVSNGAPYVITRTARGESPTFMARSTNPLRPELWAD